MEVGRTLFIVWLETPFAHQIANWGQNIWGQLLLNLIITVWRFLALWWWDSTERSVEQAILPAGQTELSLSPIHDCFYYEFIPYIQKVLSSWLK